MSWRATARALPGNAPAWLTLGACGIQPASAAEEPIGILPRRDRA